MTVGVPPGSVTSLLRLDGLAVAVATIVAFVLTGPSWWFLLLWIVPDLSGFALLLGTRRMAVAYNLAHSYVWSVMLVAAGILTPLSWLLPVGLVWANHIGIDRAIGYGLKYPDSVETTHLGLIGKARKAARHATAA